jgi:catechol 2,3-dioxygenase-like lactoylglutathione lyase family enzyme
MWVDVSSPDLDKSRVFYNGLFGWDAQVAPDPQAGEYTIFTLDGKMVAGSGPTFGPDRDLRSRGRGLRGYPGHPRTSLKAVTSHDEEVILRVTARLLGWGGIYL